MFVVKMELSQVSLEEFIMNWQLKMADLATNRIGFATTPFESIRMIKPKIEGDMLDFIFFYKL